MPRLISTNPETLNQYARDAWAAIAPPSSTAIQCCAPFDLGDGRWSIGCPVCLPSAVPLPDGVVRDDTPHPTLRDAGGRT